MTQENMEDIKALLDAIEYVGNGDIYVDGSYAIALKRLIEENKKLKHQAILSSRGFQKCYERLDLMIELLIKEKMVERYNYDNMTEQDIYREYEQIAMSIIEKRKKKK